jgi:protein dithiol:quinone oxidoreductase
MPQLNRVLTPRRVFFILALGCLGLIVTGLYMQYVMQLIPCALCITQRVFIIGVGLTALIAGLHAPHSWGQKIYAGIGALLAVGGGSVSARHVHLENLPPDQVPACGPDILYMFENFPLKEALELLFRGDGNCSEVAWRFLGLSIPSWTLVAFAGLLFINLWQFFRSPAKRQG